MELKGMFLLLLTACGPDAFFTIGPLVPNDAGDAETSAPDLDAGDARVDVQGDSSAEAAVDAGDGSCLDGTEACTDAWMSYCARVKTCCNGGCANSWQNNGGAECYQNFFGGSGIAWCSNNRSSDMRCAEKCISDIQNVSCTTIKSTNGLWMVSSTCNTYWQ